LIRERIPEIMLLAIVGIYSIVFSYLTILKLQAFGMYAWDLGIYHQAIHTTATSGSLLFSTVEWPYTQTVTPPGTTFGVHFSPFLLLIVPFYALLKSSSALLVLKTIFISAGAIPTYFLAKKAFGNSFWGLIFASAYLLFPAVHAINWYDFQPQTFLPTLLLFMFLFIETKRARLAGLFAVLSVSTVEIAPFFVIATGLSYLLLQRKSILELFRHRKYAALFKSIPVSLIVISFIWLALIFSTSVLFGWQTASFHPSITRRLTQTTSFNLFGALGFDLGAKITYFMLIFGPLSFLSLLDPIRLFPGALWVLYSAISVFPPYYSISFHYPSFVIPFVIVSSIFGLKWLLKKLSLKRKQLTSVLLCLTVGFSAIVASPLGPFHIGNHNFAQPFGIPSVTAHDTFLQELIDLIPQNSSVLTDNNIFPHVSGRKEAYVFPFSSAFQYPADFQITLESYLQKVEFVLIDGVVAYTAAPTLLLTKLNERNDFGVYAEADGGILFKKDYTGSPVLFVPFQKTLGHEDFVVVSGETIADISSQSQNWTYNGNLNLSGDFWSSRESLFLSRGNYSANFRLKFTGNSNSSSQILVLEVVNTPANVTLEMVGSELMWFVPKITVLSLPQEVSVAKPINASNFIGLESYWTFELQFSVERPASFAFVGLGTLDGNTSSPDNIKLRQVSP
jgi:uncharacterized membrane protein